MRIRDQVAKRCGSATLGVALLVSALLHSGDSAASFIRIEGTNALVFHSDDQTVTVTGTYQAMNQGDETAKDLFVTFQLGQWASATEKKSIGPGGQHTWTVEESFQRADLACSRREDDLCADQQLPVEGIFPLRVARHYQDANGYPFSAVTVDLVTIGELSSERRFATQVPGLKPRWEVDSKSGQDISGRLEVQNLRSLPLTVSLGLVLPHEFTATVRPQRVDLEARASATLPLAFTNIAGLPGSTYGVVAVLQWEESGIRNSTVVFQSVSLGKPDPGRQLLVVVVAVGIAASVVLFSSLRRSRRMRAS